MGLCLCDILAIWPSWISERVRKAMPAARTKDYHLGRPPIGFAWVKASKTFEPTDWAFAIETDAATLGMEEAGRLHPYEEGRNRGRCVPQGSGQRILENLKLYQEGRLVPNQLSKERYGYEPSQVSDVTMNTKMPSAA